MAVYTFIMEYRGGTYISQVTAASVGAAILPWANQLPVDEIAHFGPRLKARLVDELARTSHGGRATELNGVTNVWHVSVPMPGGASTVINAVKTDTR